MYCNCTGENGRGVTYMEGGFYDCNKQWMHFREWRELFKYVHIQSVMKVQYIFTIQYNPFVRYSVPLCTLFWQFNLKPAKPGSVIPVLFQTFVVAKCLHDVYIRDPKNKFSWKVLQFCGVEIVLSRCVKTFWVHQKCMSVTLNFSHMFILSFACLF